MLVFKTCTPCCIHPWQVDQPLSSLVEIDISNHYTQNLPSPNRWHISQQNAEYSFRTPTERFFTAVQSSCFSKQTAELNHHVLWSRHLLSCIRGILGTDLLIGAWAVAFNPHFQHFFSPDAMDLELGDIQTWPAVPALSLLAIDSFAPTELAQILVQASNHCGVVSWWVLCKDQQSVTGASDLISLSSVQSRLVALLPANCVAPRAWFFILWSVCRSRVGTLHPLASPSFSTVANELTHSLFCSESAGPLQPSDVRSILGCWHQIWLTFSSH